jgi:hypothetical protein
LSSARVRPAYSGMRVADKLLRVFEYACVMGDRETATSLLTVLENLAMRRAKRFGGDRRHSGIDLDAAHARLLAVRPESSRFQDTAANAS